MSLHQTALELLGQAVKLPLHLFADDYRKVHDRLDALHNTLPDSLPTRRFFRH